MFYILTDDGIYKDVTNKGFETIEEAMQYKDVLLKINKDIIVKIIIVVSSYEG